jgi:FtsP/CotA-like multicopper oxidase with cupredoxin domain
MDMTARNVATDTVTPATRHLWRSWSPVTRSARRQFLRRSLVITVGAALSVPGPSMLLAADPQPGPACPATNPAFTVVPTISSHGSGTLQAVITVRSGTRNVPTAAGSPKTPAVLRYFSGYEADPAYEWPVKTSADARPGPTLSAEIGDVVHITLLNHVKLDDFPGTFDSGEQGIGCDQGTTLAKNGTPDPNRYPFKDKYPNCFHGSSSANIHFHGTHVTPSSTGDNVLVNVRPNPSVTEADVKEYFGQIFKSCKLGEEPRTWAQLPHGWTDSDKNPKSQKNLLIHYDRTAPYVGPGRNPDGHGLPPELQLWPQNQLAITNGIWPQWYSGSYPYCFQIPRYTEDKKDKAYVKMGQAPGTHWYHSHKHGSTSINLFNGLAGAFIITDTSPTGYDGMLRAFYKNTDLKLKQQVLVLQQITNVLNMLSATGGGAPPLLVNGELTPTITMQPGEVQLWRIVNATVQNFVNLQPPGSAATAANSIQFKQTAQDGVQYDFKNYIKPQNGTTAINMAPANRVDLLVQAPTTEGCYQLNYGPTPPGTALVNVTVTGKAVSMGFPAADDSTKYPPMPPFLADIEPADIRLRRDLTYGATKDPTTTDRRAWQFTIDGKQFQDQVINQVMLLDSAEEWTVYNSDTLSGITHPFHIHVNPFQIVEVFDPTNKSVTIDPQTGLPEVQRPGPPYIWWDTFAIPAPVQLKAGQKCPSKVVDDGTNKWCSGYFKMRSRFADFTGQYVQHCHLLAHEDRGMMQLLEVVTDKTILKHH